MSHFPSKLCNEMIKLRLEAQKKKRYGSGSILVFSQ
jgi:hypothetical protein